MTNFPTLPGVLRRQSIFLILSKAASGATKNEQKSARRNHDERGTNREKAVSEDH